MAKENPQASDENELEIVEEEEEEEEQTDSEVESDDPSDPEPEPEPLGKETSKKRKFESLEYEEDWFDKFSVPKKFASFSLSEDYLKECWRSSPMETKKYLEEEWWVLQGKLIEVTLLESKFKHDFFSFLAKAKNP